MTPLSETPLVVCADRIRALNSQHAVLRTALGMLIFGTCVVIGIEVGRPWIGVVGILLVAGTLIIPHMLRQDRFFATLQCPHCQQAAGRYGCRKTRVYLFCEHCGKETPTDCCIPYNGAQPMKIW